MSLISDRDVFNVIVSEWLTMKDLVNLDTAIVSEDERPAFLDLLSTVPYKAPFSNDLEKWWKNHKDCLKWLLSRRMLSSEGMWHVNHKLWGTLLDNTADSQGYKELVATLKGIFFEGFNGPFNMRGLELAVELKDLYLCNLNSPQSATSQICPALEHLTLQNSKVCDVILRNFMHCPNLKSVDLRHVTYGDLTDPQVMNNFLRKIESIKVLNNVTDFKTICCTAPNDIKIASLDMLHTTGNTEYDLEPFLRNSPNLCELHVERMCLDITTLFALISKYCPNLTYLHLNHIRVVSASSTTNPPAEFEVPFTRLKISTMIPSFDDKYQLTLGLTKGKIAQLELSYCEKLTDGGYLSIRDLCPNLQKLEIDDKKSLFEGVGDNHSRVSRIAEYFAAVPEVKISLWEDWYADSDKQRNLHLSEVRYQKGFY